MLRISMTNTLLIGMMTLLSAGTALAQTSAGTQTPESVSTPATPYLLAGDDVLSINLVNSNLNLILSQPQVVVQPDGKLIVQGLEPFSVLGKTMTEVAQMLTEKWKKYGINPYVSVSLIQKRRDKVPPFMAPADRLLIPEIRNRIFVCGAVGHPGFYVFQPGDRLMDALNGMGGPTSYANLKKVTLLHIAKDKKSAKTIVINLEKYLKTGDFKYNMPLTAGDVVFVPEKKDTTPAYNLWGVLSGVGLVKGFVGSFTGHFGD